MLKSLTSPEWKTQPMQFTYRHNVAKIVTWATYRPDEKSYKSTGKLELSNFP